MNFDLRDEANIAIPVLTTRQNGEAALSMLTGVGRLVLNDDVCDPVCSLSRRSRSTGLSGPAGRASARSEA